MNFKIKTIYFFGFKKKKNKKQRYSPTVYIETLKPAIVIANDEKKDNTINIDTNLFFFNTIFINNPYYYNKNI